MAVFPFHNAAVPSFSMIEYATLGTSRKRNCAEVTWYNIFIRSMGATNDLAIIPAIPPARRLRISFGSDWMVDNNGSSTAGVGELPLLLLEPPPDNIFLLSVFVDDFECCNVFKCYSDDYIIMFM